MLAERDETVHPSDILDLPRALDVTVRRVAGTHALPYDDPEATADLVLDGIAGRSQSGHR